MPRNARKSLLILVAGIHCCLSQSYIVKFRSDVKDTAEIISRLAIARSRDPVIAASSSAVDVRIFPANSRSGFPWRRYAILRFRKTIDRQMLESIASNSFVESLSPTVRYSVYSTPNDSAYPHQWNLRRIGISALHTSDVITSMLPSVKVGVVDTGIDDDHPDLKNVLAYNTGETGNDVFGNDKTTNGVDDDGNGFIDDWGGYDFVDLPDEDTGDWNEPDNSPADEHGHGTMVAGIIGAETNNGIGITGIAPCRILPIRAFGKSGNGIDFNIASAIVYAVDNGAEVINMSFGDVVRSPILQDAIRYAYDHNVVCVASSGNDGSDRPHFPSDFNEVISVGSVGRFDSRSLFSSHSPALDVMAPGEEIATTTVGKEYTNSFSGTSAAAPHVAGIAALMKSIERKKSNEELHYVPFSNEEIRGILLNAADDAGPEGWDRFFAAGIANADKATQAVFGTRVQIHSPAMDEILSDNFSHIVITAVSPYLKSVSLYYGRGESPLQWELITSVDSKIFIRDTVNFLEQQPMLDDVYVVRLVVHNSKGNDVEYRQRIVMQRDSPKIVFLRFRDSVIVGDKYGATLEASIDRNSAGYLYFRKVGESSYSRLQSTGVQKNHFFVLTSNDFRPNTQYEFFCEFVEQSSTRRSVKFYVSDSLGSPLVLSSRSISTTGFAKKTFTLPAGFLLNSVHPVGGIPAVILSVDKEGEFGPLNMFRFDGNRFVQKDSTARLWVPRAFDKNLILVQDRGISQLLHIDTAAGAFSDLPLWGDSSDVWASQLTDLDGDTQPEIIARSSTHYLIYKNHGNNIFSLRTTLSNPSSPPVGDTHNQFGPPRSLTGDFTGSGRIEIIAADYDGDWFMYRQVSSQSLQFELAGIDSTELFDMSDYIASGDFDGDGVPDVAVAGHTNLDLNNDREYDMPVWTIRVFSHRNSDPPGRMSKIWEEHFVGVKAGRLYDNGIVSGKLKTTDVADALFLSLNPYLYIFLWNPSLQTFESKWIHPSHSNSVVIYDFDSDGVNDVGFRTNEQTEFWSMENISTTLQQPWNLSASSLSATKVKLRWNSSALSHTMYRGSSADSLVPIATVVGTEWIDSTVTTEVVYYYAVSALGPPESKLSDRIQIVPHAAPYITAVVQSTRFQAVVTFSFDLSAGNNNSDRFVIDDTLLSVSVIWKSERQLLLTFSHPIHPGLRSLRIRKLRDASGMHGDTSQVFYFTAHIREENEFFVRSVSLLGRNAILVEFNDAPDFRLARTADNYSVQSALRRFAVTAVDSVSPTSVRLNFSQTTNLSAIAVRLEVRVSEALRSQSDVSLMTGKGQVLSIAQETESLENIVVYPNPVRNGDRISFVNLPAKCTITIFSPSGEKVKIFDDVTTSEVVSWNLTDGRGNRVPSGVYLYRVEKFDQAGTVTKTSMGKLAIVR